MRRIIATGAVALTIISSASADRLPTYWQDARIRWNAVGDKAAAGDNAALARLQATVDVCSLDEVCAEGPSPASPPSQAQIDAAGAALNIGWILDKGLLADPDPDRALEFYSFANQMGHPLGAYNVATKLMSGNYQVNDPSEIVALYTGAASSGHVGSALALGKLHEKQGYKGDAAQFYVLALKSQPTQEQKQTATQRLSDMGLTAEQIEKAVAEKRSWEMSPENDFPAPQPPTPQTNVPAAPQIDPGRVADARECISTANKIRERKDELAREDRKLEDWNKDLEQNERMLNNTYSYIPPGSEGDIIRIAARNNYARFDEEVRDYNAAVQRLKDDTRENGRIVNDYNSMCSGYTLNAAEFAKVCTNNMKNLFCKGYHFDTEGSAQ